MKSSNERGNASAAQMLSLFNAQPQFDWRQYWFIIWRRKWWIILPTFLITCGSVVYSLLFIRPVYEASATIEVSPSRLLNRSVQSLTPGGSGDVDYNELKRRILSSSYIMELSRRLNLNKDPKAILAAKALQSAAPAVPFDELLDRVLIETLRKSIKVTLVPGSQLLQITAQHESRQMAYQRVKMLTEIFIDESKRNELRGIRGIMEFSNEQLVIYKAKMDEAEDKLRHFKERVASSRAQSVGLSSENVARLQELISSCEIAISDRQRRVAQSEKLLPAGATTILWNNDPDLLRVRTRINEKLANFKKSASMTTLQNNYEITLNNDINLLRQESQRLLTSSIARLYPAAGATMQQTMVSYQLDQVDLYILNERIKIAGEVLNSFVKMAATGPADQLELQHLEDDLEQNRRVYKLFSEQSRGSQIEEALQHSDAEFKYSLFEPARLPIYAVAGSKRNFVSLCFVAGLAFSVAMIFVLEFLDQSIRSVEAVEEFLHIPVWGIIPKISAPFNSWYKRAKKSAKAPETHASLRTKAAAIPDSPLVAKEA